MMSEEKFDCVILGGGPAGLSAALYCRRANLNCAIVDLSAIGGTPANYCEIENYLGFDKINGWELCERFEEHVDKFGAEKFPMSEIVKVDLVSEPKIIETTDKIFKADAVIIATGAQARKLGIEGEDRLKGYGVSYCAVCDGAFYRGKTVAVVGGGNAAVEEAGYLTKFADKVYVIHRRDSLRADKIVQERAFQNPKLEFIWDSVPERIDGAEHVETLTISNVKTGEKTVLKVDGVFPYIGFSPNADLFTGQIRQNAQGFIETDVNMETSVKGVYAVGDIRNTPLRQVITAASDGAIGGNSAVRYLETLKPITVKR